MESRPVSQAVEDYVKAIYLLEQREGKVTTKALAVALDVAAPSVTAMRRRFSSSGSMKVCSRMRSRCRVVSRTGISSPGSISCGRIGQ